MRSGWGHGHQWGIVGVLVVFGLATPGWATEQLLFGPWKVTRTGGLLPTQAQGTVEVPATLTAPFRLHVQNGDGAGHHGILGGTITVNGALVAGPADFFTLGPPLDIHPVLALDRTVSLQRRSALQVRFLGLPGSYLILSVFGTVPPSTLKALDPSGLSIIQGRAGTLTATISAVQSSATTIALQSDSPGIVSVPATVTVPAGQLAVAVPVTAVAPGTTTVTATLNGNSRQSAITVTAAGPTLTSLLPPILQITQGASGTLTVAISAVQGSDTVIALATSDTGVLGLPPGSALTIAAGQVSQAFQVMGLAAGIASVTAGPLNGTTAQSQVAVIPPPPVVVSLAPPVMPIAEGSSGTLTVTLNASQSTDIEVALATSDPAIVGLPGNVVIVPAHTLSVAFSVTGLARGTATVTADLNGTTVTSAVTVQPPIPTVANLTCPPTLTVGVTGQCMVTLNATQITETMVPLASSDVGVASVPVSIAVPAGVLAVPVPLVAVGPGIATITAGPLNETNRQAAVQVLPPPPILVSLTPNPTTLMVGASAILTLNLNAAQPTDTGVALGSQPTGIVTLPTSVTVPAGSLTVPIPLTGTLPGTTTVTAGPLNGASVETTVTVNQLPPTVMALTPNDFTLPKGTAEPLTVTIAPVQPDTTMIPLASTDPASVEVPASVPVPAGSAMAAFPVIGRNVGVATVTAGPLNGTTTQATVTVTPPALLTLTITPTAVTVAVGQAQPFLAIGTYTDGTTQDLAPTASWTSSDEAITVVTNPGGVVTARAVGQASITVTAEGKSAMATLTVTPPVLTVLVMTPTLPTRAVGQTVAFQAAGTYTDGTTQDLSGTVGWASSEPTVAAITSPGGLATALTPGSTTVTATHAAGMTVSTVFTVNAPTLVSLALTPANPSVTVGQQLQLTATGTFTNSTTQNMTAQATWTSGTPLAASVSGAGLVTGLTAGTTTISATHATGVTGSTSVTVVLPPPTVASLEPVSVSIPQGGSGTLTVTLSAVQPGETSISLVSSDSTVAAVPATILVSGGSLTVAVPVAAVSAGTATITATLNGSSRQSAVTVVPGVTLTSLLPATLAVRQGASGHLMVTLSAVQDTDTVVTLTSSSSTVVGVPPTGMITIPAGQRSQTVAVNGVSPGTAAITAALNGSSVQSHVAVTIAPPTVASLDPPVLALAGESTGTFTVTLNATQPTDTEVLLALTDETVVSLPAGRIIVPANTPSAAFTVASSDGGLATITASLNGSSVSAAVLAGWSLPGIHALTCPNALAVGATGRCTVTLNFAQPTDTTVPLTSGAPAILDVPATVTIPANTVSITFAVTAVTVGNAPLAAGPLTGTTQQTTIQVVPPSPTLVSLLPTPAAMVVGAMTTLTAAVNAAQATDTVMPVTSSGSGLVTVPATVTLPAGSLTVAVPVTGIGAGTTTVTLGPLNGTQVQSTLTVAQAPPTIAAVTPAGLTIVEWNAVALTVTLSATQSEPTVLTLLSSDPDTVTVPAILTVPAFALSATVPVLGWLQGTASVTLGPLNGSAVSVPVTVVPWEVASFAIVPQTATVPVGQTQQFSAIAAYNDEILEDDTESAWWAAGEETVARFDTRGAATALAPGTTAVYAGVGEEMSATPATLTVTPTTLASLTLTPTNPLRAVGESVQFQTTGTFTDGTTQELTQTVTWASSTPAVATIPSSNGLATALTPGTTTITAAYPGVPSASTTLTVAILAPTIDALLPNKGRIGMAVTVLGTNLGATSAVRFNGAPAAFTVQSLTQVTATVPAGATTGPVTATTPSGTGTSTVNFTLTAPPTVAITSPTDGATVTGNTIQITGTVASDVAEIAVSVNGVAAQVNSGHWVAQIAVQPGSNVLTATAVDSTGAQATASITVIANAAPAVPLLLRAIPDSGIAPLTVRWQVTNLTGRPLVQYELDAVGTGAFGAPLTNLDGAQTTHTTPGLLHPILRATDDQGAQYLATTTVNVLPQNQVDDLIRAKWNGMKAAIRGNAIEAALTHFLPSRQDQYRALFTALQPQLAQIAAAMEEIEFISLLDGEALYRLPRTEMVGGRAVRVSYYVYFIQGRDGVWRIRDF